MSNNNETFFPIQQNNQYKMTPWEEFIDGIVADFFYSLLIRGLIFIYDMGQYALTRWRQKFHKRLEEYIYRNKRWHKTRIY
ncbi:hypothetical protein LCGC14_1706450 [marine sediment metagenome]|uniref:Uncharacterized protein n=1 Tax=marine sediment metagenome TaxID=412755 RepID=A0A0F9KGH7_9ZZZZ